MFISNDQRPACAWLVTAWHQARAAGASDLFLTSGLTPQVRVRGQLLALDRLPCCPPPPWSAMTHMLGLAADHALAAGHDRGAAEGVISDPVLGRARWSLARQQRGLMLVLRLLRDRLPTLAEVQIEPAQATLVRRGPGLLLITGSTGSGKSCTLAALVQHWREHHDGHVLTLEDPVEFLYPEGRGLVSQHDVGRDCPSYSAGLHAALRQNPDLILIGELRDRDSAHLALAAAETGHLVLATLHTASAVGAIDRLLGLFPGEERELARVQLADSLIAVMTQQLLPAGGGLQACREVLVATPAIRHLIREQRLCQIETAMQTGQAAGMQTRAQALSRLQSSALQSANPLCDTGPGQTVMRS